MMEKANCVTWLRWTVLPRKSQGPDGACRPAPHTAKNCARRPRTATSGVRRGRDDARVVVPTFVAAARPRLLTPSGGAAMGSPTRGGRSHPPARVPCRPARPSCSGALRGGVTAPPVGIARRCRAAAAAVAEAAPLSPPDAPPTTATWLYVPLRTLAAMKPAGVPGIDASPSTPPP